MLPNDRTNLRNLVIVMVATTGVLVGAGTTCLGRDRARQSFVLPAIPIPRPAERTSSPEPVSTTSLTSADLGAAESTTPAPTTSPASTATTRTTTIAPAASPHASSEEPAPSARPRAAAAPVGSATPAAATAGNAFPTYPVAAPVATGQVAQGYAGEPTPSAAPAPPPAPAPPGPTASAPPPAGVVSGPPPGTPPPVTTGIVVPPIPPNLGVADAGF